MTDDISQILLSQIEISNIVKKLGEKITNDYQNKNLLLVGILKGSAVFMTDLMRAIDIPLKIDFMAVSSYGETTNTTGTVKIIKDLSFEISEYDVILIEDILDTGTTLTYLTNMLKIRNPKSLKVCTLLNKPERRVIEINVDYIGIDVPNEFIVGYGLDYSEKYRNLPYIGVLSPSIYNNASQ